MLILLNFLMRYKFVVDLGALCVHELNLLIVIFVGSEDFERYDRVTDLVIVHEM